MAVQYDIYGGIIGCTPTQVFRFVQGDDKHHTHTDPASGATGHYRVGLVKDRAVIVSPLGNAMYARGAWNVSAYDGSGTFQAAAAARFGVANQASAVSGPTCDLLVKALSEVGWNYCGGNTNAYGYAIPRQNSDPAKHTPAQRPGSPYRKPACPYNSHQLRAQVGYAGGTRAKNIAANFSKASMKNMVGPIALPDAFDDPDVMPGAPGGYKNACNWTINNYIADPAIFPTWTTSPYGPEFAPATTPWWLWFDFTERDFCGGMANYHRSVGYTIAACPPTMTSAPNVGTQTGPFTYNEPVVWSKKRWQQYVQDKYKTIAAVNQAWGANYTTFDSAGGYQVGTGLLDEDGTHPWFGTDAVRLTDCNATLRDDLDEIERLFWHQLIGKLYAQARLAYPRILAYAHTAGSSDASWIYSQVCAQYVDIVGGDKDIPDTYFYSSNPSGKVPLTLQSIASGWVSAKAGAPTWNRHHRGTLLKAQGGYGIVQKWISPTEVHVEVLQPYGSPTIPQDGWTLGPPAESLWLKYKTPNISWQTVISTDSYFTKWSGGSGSPTTGNAIYCGNPNGGGGGGSPTTKYGYQPAGTDTQAKRAECLKKIEDARYGYKCADGSNHAVGQQWWACLDKWSEGTAFGLVSIDCKKYDGKERAQNGNFYTPVLQMNQARDAALLAYAGGGGGGPTAPPAPTITGSYKAGDTAVNGTGQASATVTVYVAGASAGTTQVAASGAWSRPVPALQTGQVLTAKQNDGMDSPMSNAVTVQSGEQPVTKFKVGDKVKTDGNPHTSRATPDGNAPGIGTIPGNSKGTVIEPGEVADQGRPGQTQTKVDWAEANLPDGFMSTPNLLMDDAAPPTTGTLTGVVTGTDNAPLAQATVASSSKTAQTDSAGRYTLAEHYAGACDVTATATGYDPKTSSATVTAGQSTTLDFGLTATSSGGGGEDGELEARVTALEAKVTKLEADVKALQTWRADIKSVS